MVADTKLLLEGLAEVLLRNAEGTQALTDRVVQLRWHAPMATIWHMHARNAAAVAENAGYSDEDRKALAGWRPAGHRREGRGAREANRTPEGQEAPWRCLDEYRTELRAVYRGRRAIFG